MTKYFSNSSQFAVWIIAVQIMKINLYSQVPTLLVHQDIHTLVLYLTGSNVDLCDSSGTGLTGYLETS